MQAGALLRYCRSRAPAWSSSMSDDTSLPAKQPPPTNRPAQRFDVSQVAISLGAGTLGAVISLGVLLSLGALIFAGPLNMFLANGIGLFLAGTTVMALIMAFLSSRPGIVVGGQEAPAVVVAVIVAEVARMLIGLEPEVLYATVVASIVLTSLVTGAIFLLLGWFRLGSFARYFPYPVVGGFLAGTGWLLVLGGIGVMTGAQPDLANLSALFQPDRFWLWLPGVLFGVALLLILRRTSHPLALPGLIVAGTTLYFLWLALAGITVDEALGRGWLLGPFTEEAIWAPLTPAMLAQVHWPAILSQANAITTVALISVVGLVLNVSGLQIATRADIDLNHELRAMGVAQAMAGLAGSTPGFHMLSLSVLGHRIGARTRLVSVGLVMVYGLILFFGIDLIALLPRSVLGGIVVYLGLGFLAEWLYDSWAELPRLEYAMVVTILALIIAFGILPGVVAGLALAVILFVIAYSRIDVVKHMLSGATIKSRMSRSSAEEAYLRVQGGQTAIFVLQGFLFFGTAYHLYEQVRQRAYSPDHMKLRFVLLDFRLVPRLDSTAMLSFTRLLQLAEAEDLILVFTQITPEIQRQLERSLLRSGASPHVRIFANQDHGLEWCEEQLRAGWHPQAGESDLPVRMAQTASEQAILTTVLGFFERRTFQPGEYLIRKGDASDDLFFIEAGQVTARVVRADGVTVRLESMRAGRIVGELGFFLGSRRTADVVADEAGSAYRITHEGLRWLEVEHPEAATVLNRIIARLLSERVVHLMDTVDALQH